MADTPVVVRGGRGPSKLEMEQEQAAAQKARAEAWQQRKDDLQHLLQQPQFIRFVRHWIQESQAFQIEIIPQTSELYAKLGRQKLGVEMYNEVTRADPRKLLDLLDLTHDEVK